MLSFSFLCRLFLVFIIWAAVIIILLFTLPGKSEFIAGFIHLNANLAIFRMFRLEQLFSQRLFYILLDGPFERAGTILFVKAFFAEKIFCSIGNFHRKAQLVDAVKQFV